MEQEIVIAAHRICYGGAAAVLLLLFQTSVFQTPAFAQGTQDQRDACTPDAFRLCGAYMPDPGRVEACLRAAGPNLSRPCYAVFFPPQDVPPPQPAGPHRRLKNQPMNQPMNRPIDRPMPPSEDDDDN
jgi:hypothetical protein